jgi:hypothetical protein
MVVVSNPVVAVAFDLVAAGVVAVDLVAAGLGCVCISYVHRQAWTAGAGVCAGQVGLPAGACLPLRIRATRRSSLGCCLSVFAYVVFSILFYHIFVGLLG